MPHGRSPRHVRKAKPSGKARPVASPEVLPRERSTSAPSGSGAGAGPRATPKPVVPTEPVRLQRLLAGAGFGSRREVEALIEAGRVEINGEVAELGSRARPGRDDIRLDGERVLAERPVYWILNKPRGIVTTVRDEAGRRTVLDLVPRKLGRVFPVGRLDVETQGLLLLTNDGETAYALLHPSLGNEREYRVSVKGQLDAKAIARIEKGVHLEEGRTAPGRVRDVRVDPKSGTTTFSLTLIEGRNRQIRRSLLVLGFPVKRLVRERMGPLRLEGMPVGEGRALTPEERARLLAHVAALRSAAPAPRKPRRSSGDRRATGSRPRLGLEPKRVGGRPQGAGAQRGASSRKGTRK